MGFSVEYRPFSEVLIQRYEGALLRVRQTQDRLVTGVGLPFTDPNRLMPCCPQNPQRATPNTSVQQQLHAAGSMT